MVVFFKNILSIRETRRFFSKKNKNSRHFDINQPTKSPILSAGTIVAIFRIIVQSN
jgi:hypothetical protein